MAIIAKASGGSDFQPVPVGIHHAVCYSVIDLGTQPSNNPQFGDARKVLLIFELPEERGDFTQDGQTENKPRVISKEYTLSIGAKANLRRDLESWRGRPFTKEEASGFDVTVLAGVNCQLNITHKEAGSGKIYANITAIVPLGKSTPKLKAENDVVVWSMPNDGTIVLPDNVPEWIAKKVEASAEYQEQIHGVKPAASRPRNDADMQAFPTDNLDGDPVDDGEDVPF